MRLHHALALTCALLSVPFSIGFADVESDILHGNTYQETNTVYCDTGSSCDMLFQPTTHLITAVTAVSCSFTLQAGAQIVYAQLNGLAPLSLPPDPSTFNLPVYVSGSDSNNSYSAINAQVQLFIKKGYYPYIYLNTTSSFIGQYSCTISGYHS